MQTLIFRTQEKTTTLYKDLETKERIPEFSFDNVITVSVRDSGTYYEIMRKENNRGGAVPVARLPIAMTNMLIVNE